MKYITPKSIVFILIFAFLASTGIAATNKINWLSYKAGIAAGKKEAKKVFIYFYNNQCSACARMDRETLANSQVIDMLNKHFIAIRVNTNKQRSLANRFYVQYLPTSYFISDSGEKIRIPPGYYAPKEMMILLEYIRTDSYKKMSINEFIRRRG